MHKRLLSAALTLLIPSVAQAIQLQWSSGSTALSFATATRCTLVVSTHANEEALPSEWVLRWTASRCGKLSVVLDTTSLEASVAHVSNVGAVSRAESDFGITTAEFRAEGSAFVTRARYIFDLPAQSAGKFQVVWRPVDAGSGGATALHSEVVTFNGGLSANLPPVITRASSDHQAPRLSVEIRGVGLGSATAAAIVSPDLTWQVPLQIDASTDSTLVAHGDVASTLPNSVIQLHAAGSSGAAASLAAPGCTPSFETATSQFNYRLYADPDPGVSTKDFALHQNITKATGQRLYHLFYIRHVDASGVEPGLGHAWSPDLTNWRVDVCGFLPAGATCDAASPTSIWDSRNVWAPSIVEFGDSTYIFYAGVDLAFDQRIGLAATADLDTCNTQWTRRSLPTYAADSTTWAARRRISATLGRQFRDPFVFPHPNPDSAGKFFMVFAQGDTNTPTVPVPSAATVVGLARNRDVGSLARWVDLGYYRSTGVALTGFGSLEGPMMLPERGSASRAWSMFTNANSNCSNATSSIRFERLNAGKALWDTTAAGAAAAWQTPPATLFTYLNNDSTVWGWNGIEYLRDLSGTEYLAGFTAFGQPRGPCPAGVQGIAIAQLNWRAPSYQEFVLGTNPPVTAVDGVDSPHDEIKMRFVEFRPAARRVSWRITLPATMPVELTVYDVMGRLQRRLLDVTLPAGESTVTWDTADVTGANVRSGMYYARLSFQGGARIAVVPITR